MTHEHEFIHDVRFSPDGASLVIAGHSGHLSIWNANNGDLLTRFDGLKNDITSVCICRNYLIHGDRRGDLSIRDLASGRIILSVHLDNPITRVSMNPSEDRLVVSSGQNPVVFDVDKLTLAITLGTYDNVVECSIIGDGGLVVVSDASRVLSIREAKSGSFVKEIEDDSPIWGVVPIDSDTILSIGYELKLWRISSGEMISNFSKVANIERDVIFAQGSSNGAIVALSYPGGDVELIEINSGDHLCLLTRHTKDVLATDFTRDQKTIATGGYDGIVQICDVQFCSAKLTISPFRK